jgi:predicted amidohydrolase
MLKGRCFMEKIKVAAASISNFIGDINMSIRKMEIWADKAKLDNADLILFPELNLNGYILNAVCGEIAETVPGPAVERVISIAEKYSIIIGFGVVEKGNDKLYCTHVLVDKNGIIDKQRKVHVPVQESSYWQSGTSINVFNIGFAKVGISICRDSSFPEYQRTLYFKGAEIVLMPFSYYNVPRSKYLNTTHHGRSILVNSWNNGFFSVFCNNAGDRPPNKWEKNGRKFPGWAGIIDPWGNVICFTDSEGNDENMVVAELDPEILNDRRKHPNFLAEELHIDFYTLSH